MPWVTAMFTAMVISMVGIQWWFNGWRGPCCQGHRPSPPAWAFFPCHDQCLGSLFARIVPDVSMLSHGHPWLGWVRGTFISLPLASRPAIERWPQGSLMCTLGGSPREKQKRKEGEEEEGTKTKTKGCMFFGPGHPFFGPVHVFWTWPDFFWTWGHEKCGGCACVFPGPCGDIFLDLHAFVRDPGTFF